MQFKQRDDQSSPLQRQTVYIMIDMLWRVEFLKIFYIGTANIVIESFKQKIASVFINLILTKRLHAFNLHSCNQLA